MLGRDSPFWRKTVVVQKDGERDREGARGEWQHTGLIKGEERIENTK